jgi:hypothetical protein
MTEHQRSRGAATMHWPDPGEEAEVKTALLEDDAAAK